MLRRICPRCCFHYSLRKLCFVVTGCHFLSDVFRVYEVEWNADVMIGRIDGTELFRMDIGNNANVQAFTKPFFIILNLAVGGIW